MKPYLYFDGLKELVREIKGDERVHTGIRPGRASDSARTLPGRFRPRGRESRAGDPKNSYLGW